MRDASKVMNPPKRPAGSLRERPQHQRPSDQFARPDPVHRQPHRQLREGIGDRPYRLQRTDSGRAEAEGFADLQVADRQRRTVDIIQRDREGAQANRQPLHAPEFWRNSRSHLVSSPGQFELQFGRIVVAHALAARFVPCGLIWRCTAL
jgi:hypothetical protein